MTRPRKTDRHLPPCVRLKRGTYYHVHRGQWRRLGATLSETLAVCATIVERRDGDLSAMLGPPLEEDGTVLK